MAAKPAKTAADYMAMAVCPALIMILVGSLVFFLLQIGYSGASLGRLRWTLFWFVFAMVLVSRIAIEQSKGAAFLYGLALAGATSLMLTRYLGFLWGVWFLLGLIWWASNKIVWDCTLIDEDQDASGEGLLRMSRVQRWQKAAQSKVRAVNPTEDLPRPPDIPLRPNRPVLPRSAKAKKLAKPQDLHAPGLWVLYFSFAAVPVFGIGEVFLARGDAAGKRLCFLLLFAYLCSALGLLLLTSFLGLRRYLRQRYLVMPGRIASSWVTTGAGLAVLMMLLATLLPRPATPYSLAAFVTKLSTPTASASDDSRDKTESPDAKTDQGASTSGQRQVEGDGATRQEPSSTPAQGHAPSAKSSGTGSRPPSPPAAAIQAAHWMPYLIAGIVIVILLWRFWPEIRAGLASIFNRSKRRLGKGGKRASASADADEEITLLPDPFQTGQASRMSLAELVLYTFEGTKRWARARGFKIASSETPLEFAERLSEREPALANEILLVSGYFSHVAYASQAPNEEAIQVLKRLWSVIGFRA